MTEITHIVPSDFHVHSCISHDGEGEIMDYCERAARFGMRAIGFCEHVDLDPRDPVSGLHDYQAYREKIEEARARFGDRLIISMGAEVGYVPSITNDIKAFLKDRHYDYIAGSVHTVFDGQCGISDEYEALETFAKYDLREVYTEYFETVDRMILSGLFDVVGHLDLVQRYGVNYVEGKTEWGRWYGLLRRILKGAIKREMAIEINTSGIRQAPRRPYPDREIMALYRELSGTMVLLGSDAHRPDQLGSGIPSGVKLAREFGLNPSIYYKDRLPKALSA